MKTTDSRINANEHNSSTPQTEKTQHTFRSENTLRSEEQLHSHTHSDTVLIHNIKPRRAHDIADLTNAIFSLLGAVLLTLLSLYLHGITRGVEADAHAVGLVLDDWLFAVPLAFLQQATMTIIILSVVVQLLSQREWGQTAISLVGFLAGIAGAVGISQLIMTIHYMPLIDALSSPSSIQFLLPELFSGLIAFLTCAGPHRLRSTLTWSWNALIIVSAVLVMLSANSFVGMMVSLLVGRCIGLLIRFTVGSPNIGIWGQGIVHAAQSVGLNPIRIDFAGDTALNARNLSVDDDITYNSRRYTLTTDDDHQFIASVADAQNHSKSYVRQVWQSVQLSHLSLRRDRSVNDMTHHHMLMLLAVRNSGLDAVEPYAATQSKDSAILFLHKNTAITAANTDTISDNDIAHVLRFLDTAHAHGITHRHISVESLARNAQGELIVCGWENGDVTSSAAHIAADRVQILTVLSALVGVEATIRAARTAWSDEKLQSITPFVQNVLIPSSVRDMSTWNRSIMKDLRSQLSALGSQDDTDDVDLVPLSRFSLRNFITAVLVVIALFVVLTQLNMRTVIDSVHHASPSFAALSFIAGCASWIGSAITLGTYMDSDKRRALDVFISQVAQSFAAVSMPAGIGPAFVNLRFLRKTGHKNNSATAVMTATVAVQFATVFSILIIFGLFTGNNGITRLVPTGTLAIVLGILGLIIALSMIITPVRKLIMTKLVPPLKNFARQLLFLITQPQKLALAVMGSIIQNLLLGLSFWAALRAFNIPANFIDTTFIFLVANTVGSAAPTPGGLGGVETSLTVAFTGVGIPSAMALSAVLLFRVMTYWIRIPLGAAAMSYMNKHNLM